MHSIYNLRLWPDWWREETAQLICLIFYYITFCYLFSNFMRKIDGSPNRRLRLYYVAIFHKANSTSGAILRLLIAGIGQ